MKKFLIILLIVFMGGSGYFIYHKYLTSNKIDIWDMVPSSALMVYESERTIQVWNDLTQSNIWENMSSVSESSDFYRNVVFLDSITGKNGSLDRLIREKTFLVSFHKTSLQKLDWVVYIPLENNNQKKTLVKILDHYKNSGEYNFQTRIFQDMEISELRNKNANRTISYTIHDNYFVTSHTSILVEDVIRNIAGKFLVNFKTNNETIFDIPPIKNDEGNLYFDFRQTSDLLSTVLDPIKAKDIKNLNKVAGSSYFDLSLEGNRILLNGPVKVPLDNNSYFLTTFYSQEPQEVTSLEILPNRTASYLVFNFENIDEWRSSVDTYWEGNNPGMIRKKTELLEELGLFERDFYEWMGNEIGIATLESVDINDPGRLFFMEAEDIRKAQIILDDLAMTMSYKAGDSVFTEFYQEIPIRQIPVNEFPARMFGDQFDGFSDCFYMPVNNFIVFGNSSDVLKTLISDISDQNTWGKSVRISQFLENTQKRLNIGLYINFSRAWNNVLGGLNDEWSGWFTENSFQLKHFELYAIQFSNVNQNFYCSQSIQHRQRTSVIETPRDFFKEQVVVTEYPIISKPWVVRNHNDRSLEVVLQDSTFQVYLVSKNGEILWKDSIEDKIVGDIYQVDFHKNGKLQYLLPTKTRIHLIDRNGDVVDRYPIIMDDSIQISAFNLIDYDKSRNYRYMVADHDGNIYLFDKYGHCLEGWDPRLVGEPLSTKPFHARIRARDCMVMVQENGLVNVMNRRGEMFKDFPIDLNNNLRGPVFIERGADFKKTFFNVILQTGEVVKFDLEGNIIGKLQLYKTGKDSWFELIPDATSRSYVIARKDYNRINFIDKEGETIFERELLTPGDLKLQYYNFGADNQVFVVTDHTQEFSYIFTQEGELINNQPIGSAFKVGLLYSERNNNFKVYSCYGNQFTISSFFK